MKVPPPGSAEATAQGCKCPVIDNHYGAGYAPGVFIYVEGCRLHCPAVTGTRNKLGDVALEPTTQITYKKS